MSDIESLPFHRKYRPNTLAGYIGNQKLKETAMKALSSGKKPQVILLWGSSGCGKAQPLDSVVLTTSGFKRMGDIGVGDEVFTDKGNIGYVSGIYPQGVRPIYRVTLSDDTYIDVSDEHLNCVHKYEGGKRKDYVLETKELYEFVRSVSNNEWYVDTPSVDWSRQEVPLDPYILGVVLGGALSTHTLSYRHKGLAVAEKVDDILRSKYHSYLKKVNENSVDYRVCSLTRSKYVYTYKGKKYSGGDVMAKVLEADEYPVFTRKTILRIAKGTANTVLKQFPKLRGALQLELCDYDSHSSIMAILRSMSLTGGVAEAHIPSEYLYNDRETRLELLHGILDVAGKTSKTGSLEFTTKNKCLSDDFAFLVRSLGIIDTVTEGKRVYSGCTIYKHSLKLQGGSRSIVTIEHLSNQECQCIMVDHEDHTYISDFFIPTHNTTFARLLAKEYSCENRDDETGACDECLNCQTINDYIATGVTSSVTNIQEINIADQSGKRDLDAVLEDMLLPSYGDEWKIYIFDECHEATSGLQNKLLKIAEEPPENVLMLFCTTNPEKMIDTLKNRCQLQLHVTKPKVKELAGLLKYVCESEQVDYDLSGLEFIANRGELTIRTALTNLQQVITEQNSAKYDSAIKVFETVSNEIITKFFRALKNKDTFTYVATLYEIKSKMDLMAFVVELGNFILRGIYTINGIQQDGVADGELVVYRDLFGDLGVAQIGNLLHKVLTLNYKNLELELLMLGYSGFDITEEKKDTLTIQPIENELVKESTSISKIVKEREQQSYEQGVENAQNYIKSASIDDLLGFGCELVSD